jgi:hypothetical protein
MNQKLTLEYLCEIHPRITGLIQAASAIKDSNKEPSFCRNKIWLGNVHVGDIGYRGKVQSLVGYLAFNVNNEQKFLKSQRAYELVANAIYESLPKCRNCSCLEK